MTNKSEQPIIIAGCGYLGKKLLSAVLTNNLAPVEQISTITRTEESQRQCACSGVHSLSLNLDDRHSCLPADLVFEHAIVYYFVPPPAQGDKDSRAKHFLQNIGTKTAAKIVLISTTGVYGNCHGQWVDENTPVKPQVDRARRRLDAEQQFQTYCTQRHIPLVILRVSGIYGPGKLPLQRIQAQTPIVREQDSPFSNRIHATDLLEICLRAGLRNDIAGIFNCADGHPTTMCDYFLKVAKANNLPEPPMITLQQAQTQLSAGMLSYMAESRRIDNQKLLSSFQLTLTYPNLDSGLAQC